MKAFVSIPCWAGICLGCFAAFAYAEAIDSQDKDLVQRLVDPAALANGPSVFLEIRNVLRSGSQEMSEQLRTCLCRQLENEGSPKNIRRICLALSVVPSEDAIVILANRLNFTDRIEMQMAICTSFRYLALHHGLKNPAITDVALNALNAVVHREQAPPELVDSAMLAVGSYGSPGFDLLMRVRDDAKASRSVKEIFYTALSETRDTRALQVLREAVNADNTRLGLRIEAAHAIGRLCSAIKKSGGSIDRDELDRCIQSLRRYLTDDAPDPLFSVAIRALAQIEGVSQSEYLQQVMVRAISSSSEARREAGLEVLYQCGGQCGTTLLEGIERVAQSDPNEDVRMTAQAIVEQCREQANVGP